MVAVLFALLMTAVFAAAWALAPMLRVTMTADRGPVMGFFQRVFFMGVLAECLLWWLEWAVRR